jgi:hypothetical protein
MLSSSMTFKTVSTFEENEISLMSELGYSIKMPEEWLFLRDV